MAKQVVCDSCRRSFLVPDEIGNFWVLCPYCEMVNPRAQQDIRKAQQIIPPDPQTWTFFGSVGTLLFLAGILGGIVGTPLVFLGGVIRDGLSRRHEVNYLGWFLLTAMWFIASVALFVAGSLLMRADARGSVADIGWRTLVGVLLALIAGVGGWVYVFETCKY